MRAKTPEEARRQHYQALLVVRFILQRGDEIVTIYSEALARALVRHCGYELVKRQTRRERDRKTIDLNEGNWTEWLDDNRRLIPPDETEG